MYRTMELVPRKASRHLDKQILPCLSTFLEYSLRLTSAMNAHRQKHFYCLQNTNSTMERERSQKTAFPIPLGAAVGHPIIDEKRAICLYKGVWGVCVCMFCVCVCTHARMHVHTHMYPYVCMRIWDCVILPLKEPGVPSE